MVRVRRLLVTATVVLLAGVPAAGAQTVFLTGAPPGSAAELVVNTAVVASATADADGLVTLVATPSPLAASDAIDASVWLDICGETRRAVIADRTAVPPSPGACARRQIAGVFRIARITSIVIDAGVASPTLRLRQGAAPASWLAGAEVSDLLETRRQAPTGLIVFGGGGIGSVQDFLGLTCASLTACSGDTSPLLVAGGVSFWFHRFFAVEGTYMKPGRVTSEGSLTDVSFTSELDGGLLALSGKAGVPLGRWRIFGSSGVNYHRATHTTTQTIDDRVVTIDDEVSQILPGGTQTYQVRTEGWGWGYGGGVEFWPSGWLGIYGEGGRLRMEGEDINGSEMRIDERVTYFVAGARIRLPGF